MAVYSTVPAVLDQLNTLLTAGAPPGVQVSYSHPGDAIQNAVIYFGDVKGTSTIPIMRANRKTREEDYGVDIVIGVARDGPSAHTAVMDAWSIFNTVEDILANDPTIGGVCLAATMAAFDMKTGFDDSRQGWAALLTATVQVKARLN